MSTGTGRLRLALGAAFMVAGTLHFVFPRAYESVVPPYLPAPLTLVLVSGAAEVAGGVGVAFGGPRPRRAAGLGLVVLLAAVFPANVQMALNPGEVPGLDVPGWLLWARLPMQPVLAAVVWWAAVREGASERP